jgi:hypothetical protein
MFAATPRGTALIARIKADPTVDGTEIRVMSFDGSYARTIRRGRSEAADGVSVQAPPAKLDSTGTRRVARHRVRGGIDAKVDGIPVVLIDLSTLGAQVISPAVMRPNQRVQVAITDPVGSFACRATVAWANFERARKGVDPSYRAGLEFLTADHAAVEGICKRNAG